VDARGWDYDILNNIFWIDMIGVNLSYQKNGVARVLMEEMTNYVRKVGVDTADIFLKWRE
jgi:GNAT superfamily N-acetyltransferase